MPILGTVIPGGGSGIARTKFTEAMDL